MGRVDEPRLVPLDWYTWIVGGASSPVWKREVDLRDLNRLQWSFRANMDFLYPSLKWIRAPWRNQGCHPSCWVQWRAPVASLERSSAWALSNPFLYVIWKSYSARRSRKPLRRPDRSVIFMSCARVLLSVHTVTDWYKRYGRTVGRPQTKATHTLSWDESFRVVGLRVMDDHPIGFRFTSSCILKYHRADALCASVDIYRVWDISIGYCQDRRRSYPLDYCPKCV